MSARSLAIAFRMAPSRARAGFPGANDRIIRVERGDGICIASVCGFVRRGVGGRLRFAGNFRRDQPVRSRSSNPYRFPPVQRMRVRTA